MDRGPRVPDNVRLQIANKYLELRKKNPGVKAPAVREVVRRELKDVPYPEWPGLSVVQKVITDIRRKDADSAYSRQDEPWCLSYLDNNHENHECEIPPHALKVVYEVWQQQLKRAKDLDAELEGSERPNKDLMGTGAPVNFSIRQVKWIALLSYIIKEDPGRGLNLHSQVEAISRRFNRSDPNYNPDEPIDIDEPSRLFATAALYARAEQLHEFIGIPFNSTEMDQHLILGIPRLLKVNMVLLSLLRIAQMLGLENPEFLEPLMVNGKIPEWLIPLTVLGGLEEALATMGWQVVKTPAKVKSTLKGAKK